MMVILLQNKFPRDPKKDRYADKIVDYFYWTAKTGTDTSKPIAFICERPADDVGKHYHTLFLDNRYSHSSDRNLRSV